MGKYVSVTVTISLSVEAPKSWKDDDLHEKVSEALEVNVTSNNKRVRVDDSSIETEFEVEAEE